VAHGPSKKKVTVDGPLPAGDNNIGNVDVASALPAGANTIGGVNIATALPAGTNEIGTVKAHGDVAHDAADSGNPVKVGSKAVNHGSSPTAVAAGDRVDQVANRHGVPFTICGHPNIERVRGQRTTAGSATLKSVDAGSKIVVTAYAATSAGGSAATCKVELKLGSTVIAEHPGMLAGSGLVEGSGAGILAVGADGEDLTLVTDATATITAVASIYTVPA
jgi:hypothetical protein